MTERERRIQNSLINYSNLPLPSFSGGTPYLLLNPTFGDSTKGELVRRSSITFGFISTNQYKIPSHCPGLYRAPHR